MGVLPGCFEGGDWDHAPSVTHGYKPSKTGIYQDMTQPISHYFVSSGHNSYLTGNQLSSKSGTKTIIRCLQAGCRVIELDVYDKQGKHGGPVCKHGGTLTKPVPVKDCLRAIKAYAFVATPYPAVVTIENHTNLENQKELAALLRSELGEHLYVPPAGGAAKGWASPEELKKKVIVRTKLKEGMAQELRELVYIEIAKFAGWDAMAAKAGTSFSLGESKAQALLDAVLPAARAAAKQRNEGESSSRPSEKAAKKVAKAAKKAADAKGQEESDDEPVEQVKAKASLEEVWGQTSRHLMRVYPAGWRVTSGNYDPTDAWNMGACFAALNWQRWDVPLWINQGKFLDNGGCGYVLKPKFMLDKAEAARVWNTTSSGGASSSETPAGRTPKVLRVHVYSALKHQGLNVCCYKDDLFVELTVKGMPCDKNTQVTNRTQDSGRLAVDKDYDFPVFFPEMAVLVVAILDHDTGVGNDYIGYHSLPLATLAEGSFKLPMYKTNGKERSREAWVKVKFSWVEPSQAANPLASIPPK